MRKPRAGHRPGLRLSKEAFFAQAARVAPPAQPVFPVTDENDERVSRFASVPLLRSCRAPIGIVIRGTLLGGARVCSVPAVRGAGIG